MQKIKKFLRKHILNPPGVKAKKSYVLLALTLMILDRITGLTLLTINPEAIQTEVNLIFHVLPIYEAAFITLILGVTIVILCLENQHILCLKRFLPVFTAVNTFAIGSNISVLINDVILNSITYYSICSILVGYAVISVVYPQKSIIQNSPGI